LGGQERASGEEASSLTSGSKKRDEQPLSQASDKKMLSVEEFLHIPNIDSISVEKESKRAASMETRSLPSTEGTKENTRQSTKSQTSKEGGSLDTFLGHSSRSKEEEGGGPNHAAADAADAVVECAPLTRVPEHEQGNEESATALRCTAPPHSHAQDLGGDHNRKGDEILSPVGAQQAMDKSESTRDPSSTPDSSETSTNINRNGNSNTNKSNDNSNNSKTSAVWGNRRDGDVTPAVLGERRGSEGEETLRSRRRVHEIGIDRNERLGAAEESSHWRYRSSGPPVARTRFTDPRVAVDPWDNRGRPRNGRSSNSKFAPLKNEPSTGFGNGAHAISGMMRPLSPGILATMVAIKDDNTHKTRDPNRAAWGWERAREPERVLTDYGDDRDLGLLKAGGPLRILDVAEEKKRLKKKHQEEEASLRDLESPKCEDDQHKGRTLTSSPSSATLKPRGGSAGVGVSSNSGTRAPRVGASYYRDYPPRRPLTVGAALMSIPTPTRSFSMDPSSRVKATSSTNNASCDRCPTCYQRLPPYFDKDKFWGKRVDYTKNSTTHMVEAENVEEVQEDKKNKNKNVFNILSPELTQSEAGSPTTKGGDEERAHESTRTCSSEGIKKEESRKRYPASDVKKCSKKDSVTRVPWDSAACPLEAEVSATIGDDSTESGHDDDDTRQQSMTMTPTIDDDGTSMVEEEKPGAGTSTDRTSTLGGGTPVCMLSCDTLRDVEENNDNDDNDNKRAALDEGNERQNRVMRSGGDKGENVSAAVVRSASGGSQAECKVRNPGVQVTPREDSTSTSGQSGSMTPTHQVGAQSPHQVGAQRRTSSVVGALHHSGDGYSIPDDSSGGIGSSGARTSLVGYGTLAQFRGGSILSEGDAGAGYERGGRNPIYVSTAVSPVHDSNSLRHRRGDFMECVASDLANSEFATVVHCVTKDVGYIYLEDVGKMESLGPQRVTARYGFSGSPGLDKCIEFEEGTVFTKLCVNMASPEWSFGKLDNGEMGWYPSIWAEPWRDSSE